MSFSLRSRGYAAYISIGGAKMFGGRSLLRIEDGRTFTSGPSGVQRGSTLRVQQRIIGRKALGNSGIE